MNKIQNKDNQILGSNRLIKQQSPSSNEISPLINEITPIHKEKDEKLNSNSNFSSIQRDENNVNDKDFTAA